MQRVVDYNESVQSRLLGFHAARRQRLAELGNFEPNFVTSAEYVDRRQPNDNIDNRNQGYIDELLRRQQDPNNTLPIPPERDLYPWIYEERNDTFSGGVEVLTPVGTRVRVGADVGEIRNNSNISNGRAQTGFITKFGVSVEQPLLKGMGYGANLASLRLAARQSEISFQEYRREFMQVVAEAEIAYWELFYAQEELMLTNESVELAQTLLDDSMASFDAGRGSQLDVLEAEAGLALRLSRQKESFQKSVEAMNDLSAFFGGSPREFGVGYVATDAPKSKPVEMEFDLGLRAAMEMNPDLLQIQLKKEQERVRLDFAKNQRLPELNVTAGVDLSGHGVDWNTSKFDIEQYSFPAWRVGLVFRVPLWGDLRGKNQLHAARLRLNQAERVEGNLVSRLRVGRDTAEQRVDTNYNTARSLERVVEFRTNLLETRMKARDVGRMDTRSVLEAEQELFVARLEQLRSEVQYQRALLELQMITGSLLQLRNLEMSFEELEYSTRRWVEDGEPDAFGLKYRVADFNRLPATNPLQFDGDPVPVPWFGINWGEWNTESLYDTPDEEPSHEEIPEDSTIDRRYRAGRVD